MENELDPQWWNQFRAQGEQIIADLSTLQPPYASNKRIDGNGIRKWLQMKKQQEQQQPKSTAEEILILLDLRSDLEFSQSRIIPSVNFFQMRADQLILRGAEMPPSEWRTKYTILYSHEGLHGYASIRDVVEVLKTKLAFPDPCQVIRWDQGNVRQYLVENGFVEDKVLESMEEAVLANKVLWTCSPLLDRCYAQVIQTLDDTFGKEPMKAMDVGCGGGRDTHFLRSNGWQVVGIDRFMGALDKCGRLESRYIHYNEVPESNLRTKDLSSTTSLIRTYECAKCPNLQLVQMELGTVPAKEEAEFFETHSSHLVLVVRYLRKPSLMNIARAVKPGGFLIYEHFATGCEHFGSPKNRELMLADSELYNLLCKDSETQAAMFHPPVINQREYLPDGRPEIWFVAQRR